MRRSKQGRARSFLVLRSRNLWWKEVEALERKVEKVEAGRELKSKKGSRSPKWSQPWRGEGGGINCGKLIGRARHRQQAALCGAASCFLSAAAWCLTRWCSLAWSCGSSPKLPAVVKPAWSAFQTRRQQQPATTTINSHHNSHVPSSRFSTESRISSLTVPNFLDCALGHPQRCLEDTIPA